MLIKLLKYDFRAMWKQFSIIWPAALVIAFLNRFTLFSNHHRWDMEPTGLLGVISLSLLFGVMFAMFVVSMVFVLTRFYRGLLGDEGYLMHTLPVKAWQLVLSKLLCALSVSILNTVVAFAAMFLMMPIDWREAFDLELWQMVFRGLARQPDALLYLLELCVLMLAVLTLMLTVVYLSMAIGHQFNRHRVLMSVVAFFVMDIVGNLLLSLLDALDLAILPGGHLAMWATSGLMIIPAAAMFLATSYLLSHRLNLE